jgi:beta-mannanase
MRTPPKHCRPPQNGPRRARSRRKDEPRRSRKYVVIALIIALPAVLSLTARAFTPTPAASTDAQGGIGAMLGAYVRSTPSSSRTDQQSSFNAFQQSSGRKLAIDHFYMPWGSTASSLQWRATWDLDNGRVPLITFGAGGDTRAVARGDQDAYLSSLAGAVRSLGKPVFLRYAPAMDVAADASWVHSGKDYVAAWRHVRQVFAGTRAAWVWSPTAYAFAGGGGGVEQYWPGAGSVDWIAADGYNRYACQGAAQGSWRELSDIFRSFYTWGSTKGKPLMIASTGTSEDPANLARKGNWFQNASRTLQTSMPNVKALVYAQSGSGGCDWRTETSDASQAGFERLAADPWFQLPPTTLGVFTRVTPTSTPTHKPVPTTTTTTRSVPTTTQQTLPPPTDPPAPGGGGSVDGKLVPSSGALWGSSSVSDSLESALGRRFDISHTYHDWDDKFPDSGELARANKGTTLFINWTPRFFGTDRIVSWSSIANGSQDSQIDATASQVRTYGRKMFMAFHTEPEPDVGRYGTAANFVAAWRHIHDRFQAKGVSNVVWVWNVTGSSGWYNLYTGGLYPGDAYVDWIGWDPYNWYTCHNNPWISFGAKVSTGYNWFMQNGFGDKPFMLSEYGSREMPNNPAAKADWYKGIVPALTKLPNLKAVVYFNNGTANPGCDWRINTTAEAQAAFAAAGHESFVNR